MIAIRLGSLAALLLLPVAVEGQRPGPPSRLVIDGVDRHFLVRAPRSVLTGPARVPLVVVLHGGGGNSENAERMTGFSDLAERERFIVVYPEGTARRRGRLLTWNAGHCCGPAMEQKVDDVRFIRTLIDTLVATLPVDRERVLVTGLSNGGMMAHRIGRELPDRVRAIAPVIAGLFGDEAAPSRPVAALIINGARDGSVPVAGGAPGGRGAQAWDGTPVLPTEAQGAFWARANACDPRPLRETKGTVVSDIYRCPPASPVQHLIVQDNGHAWPGGQRGSALGDRPSRTVDATARIWEFFRGLPAR